MNRVIDARYRSACGVYVFKLDTSLLAGVRHCLLDVRDCFFKSGAQWVRRAAEALADHAERRVGNDGVSLGAAPVYTEEQLLV
jgi:hypothetical protein